MFNFWVFSETESCVAFFNILGKMKVLNNIYLLMLLQYEVSYALDRMVQWTVKTCHCIILILLDAT